MLFNSLLNRRSVGVRTLLLSTVAANFLFCSSLPIFAGKMGGSDPSESEVTSSSRASSPTPSVDDAVIEGAPAQIMPVNFFEPLPSNSDVLAVVFSFLNTRYNVMIACCVSQLWKSIGEERLRRMNTQEGDLSDSETRILVAAATSEVPFRVLPSLLRSGLRSFTLPPQTTAEGRVRAIQALAGTRVRSLNLEHDFFKKPFTLSPSISFPETGHHPINIDADSPLVLIPVVTNFFNIEENIIFSEAYQFVEAFLASPLSELHLCSRKTGSRVSVHRLDPLGAPYACTVSRVGDDGDSVKMLMEMRIELEARKREALRAPLASLQSFELLPLLELPFQLDVLRLETDFTFRHLELPSFEIENLSQLVLGDADAEGQKVVCDGSGDVDGVAP